MSKKIFDGVWVVVCDWADPDTGKSCDLGQSGEPRMFVDPHGGRDPKSHFQCAKHHGFIPQKDRPEFQLPEGHKLNKEEFRKDANGIETKEINEDD